VEDLDAYSVREATVTVDLQICFICYRIDLFRLVSGRRRLRERLLALRCRSLLDPGRCVAAVLAPVAGADRTPVVSEAEAMI
jgi:hypothetical protein